jgi:DNA-binding XRE family transcriptional regulator
MWSKRCVAHVILIVCRLIVVNTKIINRVTTDPRVTLGENVRRLRVKLGVSQEKFAEMVGLHRTYVGGIERGERNVSLLNIVEIARALKVQPPELLKGIV